MNSSAEHGRPAGPPVNGTSILGTAISRGAAFFCFWLALAGTEAGDLAAGLVAAVAATWASLCLMPAHEWRLHPIKLAEYPLHFLHQSIAAGIDVAWRALDPPQRLRPGFVIYQTCLPPGTTREAFCAIMSLLPGTLPCGTGEGGGLTIHCLDVTEPVAEQLAAEEALCIQALGGAQWNG